MVKLYDAELSGNCYKVRLFLSALGVEHELVSVDMTRFCKLVSVVRQQQAFPDAPDHANSIHLMILGRRESLPESLHERVD